MDHILDGQLEKLKTNHIDYYLLHSLARENWDKMLHLGVLEFSIVQNHQVKLSMRGFHFMEILIHSGQL